jgi:tetratricopeptide (TPR) repeat protein
MSQARICPNCGASRLDPGVSDYCPRCLLAAALDETGSRGPSAVDSRPTPGLAAADEPRSVLETISISVGPVPRVLLRDTDNGVEPPLVMADKAAAGDPAIRYRIDGEIARGGMGQVLRGRDPDLGRDVALKVLRQDLQGNGEMVRRFVEEAQIGGQLQHPGIVPIYELGTFADRRPYFAMKLVKGETLAKIMGARKGPGDGLPRFLAIFEAIAQTVAYAHARGVIHRDLKPSNVMVGSFGEVQVMDWGLAKVLPRGGVADEVPGDKAPPSETVIATARSGSDAPHLSLAGTVLGTPSYMAPEQARGEIDRVDERADVFALGSILCEILTGRPAFIGRNSGEVQRKASLGELGDALARLDGCGADAELVLMARDCLAREPEDRPRAALEVAGRATAYLAGVQEKLRVAERERAVAEARAIEERKRRRLQAGLAASVLGLVLMGGLGVVYDQRQRSAEAAKVAKVVGEASTLRDEARAHPEDVARWQAALASVRQAEGVAGGDPETLRQLADLKGQVLEGSQAAEADRSLLDRLVDIRSAKADDRIGSETDAAYARAFREAGLDPVALAPAELGARIKARPPSVALALASSLDDWAAVLRNLRRDESAASRQAEAASVADPDPWRNELRAALALPDKERRKEALKSLADRAKFDELGAISLDLLGKGLTDSAESAKAEWVLRRALLRYPGDVWVNYDLGLVLQKLSKRNEAIRFYTAARAIRPETAHELAHALARNGEYGEAIDVFQELVRLRPGIGRHLSCLGGELVIRGRSDEAAPVLERAVGLLRETIRLNPENMQAHNNLGLALKAQGKFEEAIAVYRIAAKLRPDYALPHRNCGLALFAQGKIEAAITEYREAIRLEPDEPITRVDLAIALGSLRKDEEAISHYREAIRLQPDYLEARNNLGLLLFKQEKLDEAIASYREAIRVQPTYALAHRNLGVALKRQEKLEQAIVELREAIRLQPTESVSHYILGQALKGQGKLDDAIAEFREAIRLKPDDPDYHDELGVALNDQGKLNEVVAEFREAIRLEPNEAVFHNHLGLALTAQQKIEEAILEHREEVRLRPDDPKSHANLGGVLSIAGQTKEAETECRESIRLKPDLAQAYSILGNLLKDQGRPGEAEAAYREAIRLKPDLADTRSNLGNLLLDLGRLDEAEAAYREAIRLKPDLAATHANLGNFLRIRGRLVESVAECREAIHLKSDFANAYSNLGLALAAQGKLDEAIAAFHEAIRLKPDYAEAYSNLGNSLSAQGKLEEAVAAYRDAIRKKPDLASVHSNLGKSLTAQGKLDDAVASFREAIRLKPDFAEAYSNLGATLLNAGRLEQALAADREAIRLRPDLANAHFNLAAALSALERLDEAITEYREAIRLNPDFVEAYTNLGNTLSTAGKLDEAISAGRESIRLNPNLADPHNNLANLLRMNGRLDESVAECREAIRLKPDFAYAYSNLGVALAAQRKLDEAVAAYREAIRINPNLAITHCNLGNSLSSQEKWDESVAAYRNAIRIMPNYADAYNNLANSLSAQGKLNEAVATYHDAIRLKPDRAITHYNLGNALRSLRTLDKALVAYREAIRLKPNYSDARCNLGLVLYDQGKFDEAVAEFRAAMLLDPSDPKPRNNIGVILRNQGKLDEAEAIYREAIRLKPDNASIRNNLAYILLLRGKPDEAAAEYREAIRLNPDDAEAHNSLLDLMQRQGKLDEAIADYREKIRLEPNRASAYYRLAKALHRQEKLDETAEAYRQAIRLKPDYAEAHCNLGEVLRSQGNFARSLEMYRKGHELGSKRPGWPYPSGQWLAMAERLAALAERLPLLLRGEDHLKEAADCLLLAQMCHDTKRYAAAARFWGEGLKADPKLGDDRQTQPRYNAACDAALAGCAKGKDEPAPDEAAKAKLRKQSLEWLQEELAAWSKIVESGPPQSRAIVAATLKHWKKDSDLAGIRDDAEVDKLRDQEQAAFKQLWIDVDALLKKLEARE